MTLSILYKQIILRYSISGKDINTTNMENSLFVIRRVLLTTASTKYDNSIN